jgi:hypothetical protein
MDIAVRSHCNIAILKTGGSMKISGIALLLIGLLLGIYSFSMEVGVDVPATDFGYGVSTPAARVANVDRMEQRRNLTIFSGALIVGGVLMLGFASLRPAQVAQRPGGAAPDSSPADKNLASGPASPHDGPISISICPDCRSMHTAPTATCKCGHKFT